MRGVGWVDEELESDAKEFRMLSKETVGGCVVSKRGRDGTDHMQDSSSSSTSEGGAYKKARLGGSGEDSNIVLANPPLSLPSAEISNSRVVYELSDEGVRQFILDNGGKVKILDLKEVRIV